MYPDVFIEHYENKTGQFQDIESTIRVGPGARIFRSTIQGPLYLNGNTQVGPDTTTGKFTGFNESCYVARANVGAYCAVGARSSINPFNHPTDWLSVHEFQYNSSSYDWVEEYRDFDRLERTPDMFSTVHVGNDVWTGHQVNIMGGVTVGDGAIIAAGSVVTKDVPPYAIVAGVPATIKRLRFSESVIEKLLLLKWWELDFKDLSGLPFRDVERCIELISAIKLNKAGQSDRR